MKTIGLIGGTTWVSTIEYYRLLNEAVAEKLGGSNSAKIILYSINFAELQLSGNYVPWNNIAQILTDAAKKLQNAGADCILICANTLHIVADDVQRNINIPLIQLTEATAQEIRSMGLSKVALLGTKATMENDFYKVKLVQNGIETIIPNETEREIIQHSIFAELSKNLFKAETKEKYLSIIQNLVNSGAQGIILGCTEIPLLIKQSDCPVPAFDTTKIHVSAGIKFALGE